MRFLAILGAFLALLPAAVWAQLPPGLSISATAGFDGFQRPGAWTPVFVTMDNQSSGGAQAVDFRGFLQVECTPFSDGDAVRFAQAVDLPASARKVFTLLVRFPEVGTTPPPPLELTAENGRRLARVAMDVKDIPETNLLMGVVSEGAERVYIPAMRDGLDRFLRVRVDPEYFPESWAGLDSLDVLVLPQWPRNGLSGPARQALADWVQMGGTLVMLGGQRTMGWNDEGAKALLPVELSGVSRLVERGDTLAVVSGSAPLAANERNFVISDAKALPGTTELVGVAGRGLLYRAERGLGQVLFFANDLQAGDLGGVGSSSILDRALRPAWFAAMPLPNMGAPEDEFPSALRDLSILTGRAARPPNAVLMILLLLAYGVIVGPVNFLGLKKLGKLEWAWLTTPVLVFVFFGLIYGLGKATRSGEGILREVDVRRFRAGDPGGESQQVTTTFTHQESRYFFKPTGERMALGDAAKWHPYSSLRRQAGSGGLFPADSSATGTQETDPRTGITYVSSRELRTHDIATFITRGPVSLSGTIAGGATWVGGGNLIEAGVINGTADAFSMGWVLFAGRMIKLGPIDAGATKQTAGSGAGWTRMQSELDAFVLGGDDEEETASRRNMVLILKASFSPKASGSALPVDQGSVWFVGYRSGLATRTTIENLPLGTRSRAEVVLVRLPVAPPKGDFLVPTEAMTARVMSSGLLGDGGDTFEVNLPGDPFRTTPDDSFPLELKNTYVVFAVDLPFELGDSAQALRIASRPLTLSMPDRAKTTVEVYNLATDRLWLPPLGNAPDSFGDLKGDLRRSRRFFVRLGVTEKTVGDIAASDGNNETELKMSRLEIKIQGQGR